MAQTRRSGQIIKRAENKWLIRVYIGEDSKGKRKYFNKTVTGSAKDAQKTLNAILREKDLGIFIKPDSILLDDYLDKWLETAAKQRVSEATYVNYKQVLQLYIRPHLGVYKLSDIKALNVQTVYTKLQTKGLSPRTIRYAHTVLLSALKQAIKWGMLAINPCEAVELPRMKQNEMKAFTSAQASKFLQTAKNHPYGLVFTLALATGMRPEEYLALKWSDINLEKGTLTIQRTLLWRKGGEWYFGEPKTKRSRRTIPLPESLVKELSAHRKKQLEHRLKQGASYKNNDLVFATSLGTPYCRKNLRNRGFKKILRDAGLPENFRLYDLRHSCATLLMQEGVNPKVVSERLGHASIALTLDVYSHVIPDMQQEATEKLERILYG